MADNISKTISLSSVALPVIAISAACLIFYYAAPILVPMALAAATAYILIPVVEFLKRLKIPHSLAVLLVMTVLLATGVLIIIFGISQLASLAQEIPQYELSIQETIDSVQVWINTNFPGMAVDLQKLKLTPDNIANMGKIIFKGLGSVTSLAFSGFLLFFLTYFILIDYRTYIKKITSLFGQKQKEAEAKIVSQINQQLRGFIISKGAITAGLSIVYTIGFLILGVPYPYIWGPFAGILNLIPYIGPIIGAIPPLIVVGLTSGGLSSMLWVGIFIFVIQMVESNILTPRITSNMVDLNPLAVLVATIIWGYLWGGIGVILGIPITAVIKVFCDNTESLESIGVLLGEKEKS